MHVGAEVEVVHMIIEVWLLLWDSVATIRCYISLLSTATVDRVTVHVVGSQDRFHVVGDLTVHVLVLAVDHGRLHLGSRLVHSNV